jgi:hypothetical protein
MDVKTAASRTMAEAYAACRDVSPELPMLGLAHLQALNARLQAGEYKNEAQAHRWLGWIQAGAYANGWADLGLLMQINVES